MVVDPGSVAGANPLQFTNPTTQVTTLLFEINAPVVPNWFGVAVPLGVTDFSGVNIFFHPTPAQGGYKDSDYNKDPNYSKKAGMWPMLFHYMERLGYQLDAARQDGANPNQIVIMPFLTEAALDTGIFAPNWASIVTDILTKTRTAMGGSGPPIALSKVVVSSFSAGLIYSNSFRTAASGLNPFLSRVWDFDGYPKSLSNPLSGSSFLKYDLANENSSLHIPPGRWINYVTNLPAKTTPPYPDQSDPMLYHHLVRDFLFLHAATTF
jgi:hypothetical protein